MSETKIGLSPFANWFTNCCSDIWTSPNFFKNAPPQVIFPLNQYFKVPVNGLIAYGARNCVIKCQIHGTAIRFIGSVKAFPNIHEKAISISFARCMKTPKLFIGSNLGSALIYHMEKNIIQTLNCIDVNPGKFSPSIISADWADDSNVYYSKGYHVIQWNIENNSFHVATLTSPSGLPSKIDSIKISKLDPILLAVAFEGGQISVLKLDRDSITNYSLLTTLNHGTDEITSLAFPFYYGDYTNGILAAVARNGTLKVWDLDDRKILNEVHFASRGEKGRSKNFFSLAFVPRPPPSDDLNSEEPKPSDELSIDSIKSESSDIETSEKGTEKQQEKSFRFYLKLLASRADGKIALIDVPIDKNENKMSSLMRPLHVCGHKICHSNVVFNISVMNPFEYTTNGGEKTIQPHWDQIRLLASSISLDRQIIIYDLKKLISVKPIYPTLSLQVHDLDFYPNDYTKLLIACGDGLKIWNFNYNPHSSNKYGPTTYQIESVKHVPPQTKILSAAWHPKDRDGESLIGFGTDEGTFICVDLSKQTIVYTSEYKMSGTKARVYSCKWGPIPSDYATTLTRNWACYTVYSSGSVRAHAVNDSTTFDLNKLSQDKLSRGDCKKSECVWKDDFNYIAVGYDDGRIVICVNDGHFQPVINLDVHKSTVQCIRWHPDNIYQYDSTTKARVVYKDSSKYESWLASGSCDLNVQLNDLKMHLVAYHESKSKEPINLTKSDRSLSGHQDRIVSIAWNMVTEDRLASCATDTTVHVWSIAYELPLYVFRGHWSRVFAVSWAPWDGNLLFSAGDDNTLQVWSPKQNETVSRPKLVTLVADAVLPQIDSPVPEVNESSPFSVGQNIRIEPEVVKKLEDDEQYSLIQSSGEQEINLILESSSVEIVNFQIGHEVQDVTTSTPESHDLIKLSPDEKISMKQANLRSTSSSSIHSNSSESIMSKLRITDKTIPEVIYKDKKKSLLPRSNIMENCSTKVQTLRDIEFLLFKRYAVSGSIDTDDEELRQRNLLFLDKDEINELCQIEISNHKQNKNFSLAFQISALQGNLKDMVTEAVKTKQLTDWIVSQAASVSREFWSKTVLAYAIQLEKSGDILQSALQYASIHRIMDATRVLVKAGLFKEALVLVKSREAYNSHLIKDILCEWADVKQKETNYEFAAKVYVANMEPSEAFKCLSERPEDPKCQQLKRMIDSAKELHLDSEKDPDPAIDSSDLNISTTDLMII